MLISEEPERLHRRYAAVETRSCAIRRWMFIEREQVLYPRHPRSQSWGSVVNGPKIRTF